MGAPEMAADAIAMGLGGYLIAQSGADSYRAEVRRETEEVAHIPDIESEEVRAIFANHALAGSPRSTRW